MHIKVHLHLSAAYDWGPHVRHGCSCTCLVPAAVQVWNYAVQQALQSCGTWPCPAAASGRLEPGVDMMAGTASCACICAHHAQASELCVVGKRISIFLRSSHKSMLKHGWSKVCKAHVPIACTHAFFYQALRLQVSWGESCQVLPCRANSVQHLSYMTCRLALGQQRCRLEPPLF